MPFRSSFVCLVACLVIFSSLAPEASAAIQHPVARTAGIVPTSADLLVIKNAPASAAAGIDVAYDISVSNAGPDAATTVTLTDPLPVGLTFVSSSQNSGPAFSCTTPAAGSGGTITCTIATLALNASADFTFVAHIPPATAPGTTFTNVATVTSAADPNPENDSSAAATTVPQPQADLAVSKFGPDSAAQNTDVAYSITLNNFGPDPAQSVSLADALPGTMTFVSLLQTSGPTFSCTTPAVGASGTVTCTIDPLGAGASATFTLTVHILTAPAGTSITNVVDVTSPTFDPNPGNNEGVTGLTVTDADAAVTKSGPATGTAGQPITWTITASNAGTGPAQNVTIIDSLPAGTTFVSLVQNSGPAATCSTPPAGSPGTLTCSITTLAAGASATFTLNGAISSSVPSGSAISNTVSIGDTNGDTNLANNSATSTTVVATAADLAVTKSGPASVTAGMSATYTITLTNNGPSDAANVSLSDTNPASTTFVSEAQTAGPTFSCTHPPAGGTGTTTCTITSLTAGATATFTLVVNVSPAVPNGSTISNTAAVTSATTDPSPGNNSSTSTATVVTTADLSILKTAAAAVTAGANLSYVITATNNGPSDAASVVLTDVIPPNTTFVSESQTSGPAFLCTNPAVGSGGTVSCAIGNLPSGATATFNLVVTVASTTAAGPLSNTATVSAATTDPNPANNSSTFTTTVAVAVSDLSISKTAGAGPFGTGNPVAYTIAVANAGPDAATGIVVTDVLPAGTTFSSATPSQGSCIGTTTVTCTLGTLASGASATIALTVTLPPNAGPVSNTATVTSATADPNPANNSSTATINVIVAATIPTLSPLVLLMLALALGMAGLILRK
jgi:uncharacterized repeat protein (TIGR01451 family)